MVHEVTNYVEKKHFEISFLYNKARFQYQIFNRSITYFFFFFSLMQKKKIQTVILEKLKNDATYVTVISVSVFAYQGYISNKIRISNSKYCL